ncbi:MAG: ATP-binding protein [Oscillospiraceae bacterium]|nr:ATP-binding protein [Oscillospiraceae bacterium]
MRHSKIKLSLPLKAEYVSVARLTASGVANRAGFNFDAVEDIKVSVSEVCNRLINEREGKDRRRDDALDIDFVVMNDYLKVGFTIRNKDESAEDFLQSADAGKNSENEEAELGLVIAQVLMDEFETNPIEGWDVSMVKYISNDG